MEHPGSSLRNKYLIGKERQIGNGPVKRYLSGKGRVSREIAEFLAAELRISSEAILYEDERYSLFQASGILARPLKNLKTFQSSYSSLQSYLSQKLLKERGETILSLHVQLGMERGNVKRFITGKGSVHPKTLGKLLGTFPELDARELLKAKVQGEYMFAKTEQKEQAERQKKKAR